MTQHKSIEEILKNLDTKKYPPPEVWNYDGARNLFVEPEITDPDTLEVNMRGTVELIIKIEILLKL